MNDSKARCPHCDSPDWAVLGDCDLCGAHHCDMCASLLGDGVSLLCGSCQAELAMQLSDSDECIDMVAEQLAKEVIRRIDQLMAQNRGERIAHEWMMLSGRPESALIN